MKDPTKKRVAVYVDGFNLYHALDSWVKAEAQKNKTPENHSLKWLDLRQLAESLCHQISFKDNTFYLVKVYYFSAYGGMRERKDLSLNKRIEADNRHKAYVKALKQKGVECYLSLFSYPRKIFPLAKRLNWVSPKEKQTDVKLTMQMMEDTFENKFDIGIVISFDSDFVTLLKKVREKYHKKSLVGITENRIANKRNYKKKCDVYGKENIVVISRELIEQCQLPNVIPIIIPVNEGKEIRRPDKYRHPAPS